MDADQRLRRTSRRGTAHLRPTGPHSTTAIGWVKNEHAACSLCIGQQMPTVLSTDCAEHQSAAAAVLEPPLRAQGRRCSLAPTVMMSPPIRTPEPCRTLFVVL